MAWGWNIQFQGVYDDEGNFGADKDSMIAGVSQMLAARRDGLSAALDGPPGPGLPRPIGRRCWRPSARSDSITWPRGSWT